MSETAKRMNMYPLPWEYETHELSEGYSTIIYDADGALPTLDHLREDEAAFIVTAVNAFEPMKKALDDLLNQVIHWGDDSQLEAIAAEIKAAESALRLAEGEKE